MSTRIGERYTPGGGGVNKKTYLRNFVSLFRKVCAEGQVDVYNTGGLADRLLTGDTRR